VWCAASRRTEFSGGTPEIARGTRALPRRFGAANISETSYENRSRRVGQGFVCRRSIVALNMRRVAAQDTSGEGGKLHGKDQGMAGEGVGRLPRQLAATVAGQGDKNPDLIELFKVSSSECFPWRSESIPTLSRRSLAQSALYLRFHLLKPFFNRYCPVENLVRCLEKNRRHFVVIGSSYR
jgi:hypothetical protein